MSDDARVVRCALIIAVLAAGCGSKKSSNESPPPSPTGSGSGAQGSGSAVAAVKVVPLVWTTPGGEQLLALREDGRIEGPCGPVGKLAGGRVEIAGQTLAWSGVERTGKAYRVAPLPWTITVRDGGAVTLTNPGHPEVALGTVTGTDSEDGAQLFAALVIAAPTVQIKLAFRPAGGAAPYELTGSADLDAWTIKQGTTIVATKKREDKAPEATHPFTEAADGAVTAGGKLIGAFVDRTKCTPQDKAATALIETYFSQPR